MRKSIITFSFAFALFACSEKQPEVGYEEPDYGEMPAELQEERSNVAKVSPEERGKLLVEGSDRLSCHTVDTKLIGPSYHEVAGKYENNDANIEMLASKIIEGGKGNWGEIPMTAHPNVSKENASLMAQYILSLKQ